MRVLKISLRERFRVAAVKKLSALFSKTVNDWWPTGVIRLGGITKSLTSVVTVTR